MCSCADANNTGSDESEDEDEDDVNDDNGDSAGGEPQIEKGKKGGKKNTVTGQAEKVAKTLSPIKKAKREGPLLQK